MITIRVVSSTTSGSCNACAKYLTDEGIANHWVYEISISHGNMGQTIRVCRTCKNELLKALKDAKEA